jgi:prepilin signal peptidase PulO-like enzyme (type II secretory pathway)
MPCIVIILSGLVTNCVIEKKDWQQFVMGAILGLFILLISFMKKEAVGKGDALAILSLGCLLEGDKVFQIVFLSFILVVIFAGIGAIKKKIRLKSELPYIPFLLISEIIILLMEGIRG